MGPQTRVTILDSSALLAVLFDEPGAASVVRRLPGAAISAVNLTEVLSRLLRHGIAIEEAETDIALLPITVEPFSAGQAIVAATLGLLTVRAGLSLGDRACLALALERDEVALTADRAWLTVPHGAKVELIR